MRAILLIAALSFCGYAWSSEPTKQNASESSKTKTETNNGANDAKNIPLAKDVNTTCDENNKSNNEECQRIIDNSEYTIIFGHKIKITDGLLVLFTAFLVFVTAALIVVGWLQARRLCETIESSERTERAYIFPEIIFDEIFIGTNADTGRVTANVKFWNYGKTPAIISLIRSELVIGDKSPITLIENDSPLPPSLGIPASDCFSIPTIRTEITKTELTEIRGWEKRVFCIGKIEYLDVNGKSYVTGFCWHILIHGTEIPRFIPTKDSPLNYRT